MEPSANGGKVTQNQKANNGLQRNGVKAIVDILVYSMKKLQGQL